MRRERTLTPRFYHRRDNHADFLERRRLSVKTAIRRKQIRSAHDACRASAVTLCVLEDGDRNEVCRGYAFCSEKDNFSRAEGRERAEKRAWLDYERQKTRKSLEARRHGTYSRGQRFEVHDVTAGYKGLIGIFMLSQVRANVFALISVVDGNRFTDPVQLETDNNIQLSHGQVSLLLGTYGNTYSITPVG